MVELLATLIAAAFAIWAIVDVSRRLENGTPKVVWFAVVILIPILGPLVYYFTRKE